ncbi:hypothetical protein DIE00_02910 [Burkholderia sp. Bp8989]|nr:hypothetical protein DIE05_20270 [Burkholderia sp. Bp8995]RQS51794.1 hypothetical protein DIE00_02910 [Burkholderia sp. Bp8989]
MRDGACPTTPDAEEERMLRALVFEGAALAHCGPYVACFRGWLVRVSRENSSEAGCAMRVTAEICCRHGGLLWRISLLPNV